MKFEDGNRLSMVVERTLWEAVPPKVFFSGLEMGWSSAQEYVFHSISRKVTDKRKIFQ